MGDKGEEGVKNLEKWVISFMYGPTSRLYTYTATVYLIYSVDQHQGFKVIKSYNSQLVKKWKN